MAIVRRTLYSKPFFFSLNSYLAFITSNPMKYLLWKSFVTVNYCIQLSSSLTYVPLLRFPRLLQSCQLHESLGKWGRGYLYPPPHVCWSSQLGSHYPYMLCQALDPGFPPSCGTLDRVLLTQLSPRTCSYSNSISPWTLWLWFLFKCKSCYDTDLTPWQPIPWSKACVWPDGTFLPV